MLSACLYGWLPLSDASGIIFNRLKFLASFSSVQQTKASGINDVAGIITNQVFNASPGGKRKDEKQKTITLYTLPAGFTLFMALLTEMLSMP